MTGETLRRAKSIEFNLRRLDSFLSDAENMAHFCNGFDIHESPETTEQMKTLLLADLREKRKQEQAAFDAL